MAQHYLEVLSTPAVLEARTKFYGKSGPAPQGTTPDTLTADEIEFIGQRDSFYLGTVSADGWPYIQHRGGPPGFLHVTSPSTLAFADYKGNRQLLSVGNVAANNRVSLFLMDYPQRTRLKILGHARIVDAREQPALADALAEPSERKNVERLFLIDIVSYDWNCPQHITPRYTPAEVRAAIEPLQERVRELEAELQRLRPTPPAA
jgi:predicted pyridoxine 5'-phosphate oxidase superfamily flavin-nucleotide-binding protein